MSRRGRIENGSNLAASGVTVRTERRKASIDVVSLDNFDEFRLDTIDAKRRRLTTHLLQSREQIFGGYFSIRSRQ
jgi:hypothetical protein